MFKKLLVAVDGSEHSMRALDAAVELAKAKKAEILVLSVYRHHSKLESTHSLVKGRGEIEAPDTTLSRLAREIVDLATDRVRQQGIENVEAMVKRGQAARTIIQTAEEAGADTILLGSRGLGDWEGFLLGSVSQKVNTLARCTCITVR